MYNLSKAFLNTAVCRVRLMGKTEEERLTVKQQWGKYILDTMGFQLQVLGTPPSESVAILVGNHVSYLDIPVIMAALPTATFVAKSELESWPVIGSGAAAAGTIFVERARRGPNSGLRSQLLEALDTKTRKVVVFPAGTTSLYEELPWKKGIFKIAKQSQKTIQLFKLTYEPLRACAYVDDDHILKQIVGLDKLTNKKVTLTWLESYSQIDDPKTFAEFLRKQVSSEA